MNHEKQAFTLVELIVVVTILAILATIGFVSYSGYLTGVRDTNRIASLTAISDGLELYRTRNDLPDPDDAVDIQVEGIDIAHQGYVGSNVLQTIEYSKAGKDPKDDSYYSYYLTDDKKYYQLMAFLEESDNLEASIHLGTTHAAIAYTNRYPKVYGKRLGILTDADNRPVQELLTGVLNFTGGTNTIYKARFTDSDILEGTGSILKNIAGNASCKRIKELKGSSRDGFYTINASGLEEARVYCDMTTDGGGWTSVVRFNPFLAHAATWRHPKDEGGFYNKQDYVQSMNYNEFYVNRDQGFDGGEGLFEIIDGDLFARRGVLKDVMIQEDYTGLRGNLYNWIGFNYGSSVNVGQVGFMHEGVEYIYLGHNNLNQTGGNNRYDFPFYSVARQWVIDDVWGGSNYTGNHIVNIFVR